MMSDAYQTANATDDNHRNSFDDSFDWSGDDTNCATNANIAAVDSYSDALALRNALGVHHPE